ncbi:hypothetical protein N474_01475 [Pseudoalteromonas luteoviolacea CPMOR-2]|uniref:Uncharacterized protein n=1 Tax=Pseudoalteromonas luteoviolacea DSM 6061 TaxID=1365250 RepID=A0A166WUS9_9GAMM|nr:hypothetical protein N475_15855 [Pseudoalteromonas luteoviolacea DSM 6061]KZN54412.1 hypothetical protein N474_01475 [Pseudoalteromonas luteoviolacea CPMOR-2]
MEMLKARKIFRLLAIFLALPLWVITTVILFAIMIEQYNGSYTWLSFIGALSGALGFSYVAVRGYMPRILFELFRLTPLK